MVIVLSLVKAKPISIVIVRIILLVIVLVKPITLVLVILMITVISMLLLMKIQNHCVQMMTCLSKQFVQKFLNV